MPENYKSRNEKLSIFYQDDRGRKTLDLVRLSEIFSRADTSSLAEPELAVLFNIKAEKLCRDLASLGTDARADIKEIAGAMRKLTVLARDNAVERIVLPVARAGVAGEYLVKNVLFGENFARFYNVRIDLTDEFHQSPDDYKSLGDRRPGVKTALDYALGKPPSNPAI